MRKTIPITIGGALFHIEEDAYRSLDSYLSAIRTHFGSYPDSEEIVSDIEGRIAEEFADGLKAKRRAAVSQKDVEELVARMGTVEDFRQFDAAKEPATHSATAGDEPRRSRLYRDGDDQVLGGVCSGIAKYFDIDPVIVRLAFGLSIFLGGAGVLLYILLWISLPLAKTTSEKVEMTQGRVTLSAIEKKITAVMPSSAKQRGLLRAIVTFPFVVIGAVLRGIAAVLRRVLPLLARLAGAGMALVATAGMVGASFVFLILLLNPTSPYIDFPLKEVVGATQYALLVVSGFFIAFLPLLLVFLLGISLVLLRTVVPLAAFAAVFATWLVALLAGGVTGFTAAPTIESAVNRMEEERYAQLTRTIQATDFHSLDFHGATEATVTRGETFAIEVTGDQDYIEGLEPDVQDGVLTFVSPEREDRPCLFFCRSSRLTVTVTMPALRSLELSGVSRATVRGFSGASLALTAQGASRIDADATVGTAALEASGVSEIVLSGTADSYVAEIHGTSSLDALDFPAARAEIEVHGASRAAVDIRDSLRGEVSGPSRLTYRSRPTELLVEASGPASVRQSGEPEEEWRAWREPREPEPPRFPESPRAPENPESPAS